MNQNNIKQAADKLRANGDRILGTAALTAAVFAAGAAPASANTTPHKLPSKSALTAEHHGKHAARHESNRLPVALVAHQVERLLDRQVPLPFWSGTVEITNKGNNGGAGYQSVDTGGSEFLGNASNSRTITTLTRPIVVSLHNPKSQESYNQVTELGFLCWENDAAGKPQATIYPINQKNMSFTPDVAGEAFDPNTFSLVEFQQGKGGLDHMMPGITGLQSTLRSPDGTPPLIAFESTRLAASAA